MYEVSPLDLSMIQNMMLRKTNKEISLTLDIPVDVIVRIVQQVEKDTGLTCKTTIVELNRKTRPVKVKPNKIISKPVKITPNQEKLRHREERDKKLERSKFATKVVNLDELQSVRIDERTTIFIKPGENAVEARLAYLDREKTKKDKLFSKAN